MPVPRFISHDFWYCTSMPPESAVSEPDIHKPTVIVNFGFMLDAFTIAALSPVARIESPSLVPRNAVISMAAINTITTNTRSLYQPFVTRILYTPSPKYFPVKSFAIVNMLSHWNKFRLAEKPIAAILTV